MFSKSFAALVFLALTTSVDAAPRQFLLSLLHEKDILLTSDLVNFGPGPALPPLESVVPTSVNFGPGPALPPSSIVPTPVIDGKFLLLMNKEGSAKL